MADYVLKGDLANASGVVKVRLLLFHFVDENAVHFIYCPHLDLTGYGETVEDAKRSFEVVLEDFVDYTIKKKTLGKVLTKLGWKLKGTVKSPRKVVAPSIQSAVLRKDYVSEIFDKYPVQTYHQQVGFPALV